jgi:hypothetical protein
MPTALYIKNRREAALVAAIAREEFGIRTSVKEIYKHDRFLLNLAGRLFGADPDKERFIMRARDEIQAHRLRVSKGWI